MSALDTTEAAALAEHEAAIEAARDGFVEHAMDRLLDIRDRRLYRSAFPTFEDYCQQRWGLTRQHVNRMLQRRRVVEALEPIGSTTPNEAQARELAPLLDEPDKLRETWQQAVEQTDGKPTAAAIRNIVKPAVVTNTTTTKEQFLADRESGEVLSPEDWQKQEADPVSAARAEVAKQPVIVTGKAVERLRQARLTFEAAGSPSEVIADLTNTLPDLDNSGFWLAEIESAMAVLNGLAVALRRRNLRSVSK